MLIWAGGSGRRIAVNFRRIKIIKNMSTVDTSFGAWLWVSGLTFTLKQKIELPDSSADVAVTMVVLSQNTR